jgi:hypothetical protein
MREVEEKWEQELKHASVCVLSAARKKQADTKRMVAILQALETLRKLRREGAEEKKSVLWPHCGFYFILSFLHLLTCVYIVPTPLPASGQNLFCLLVL